MSNYQQLTLHPRTGNVEMADWLDDHFGHHQFGVKFGDGLIVHEKEIEPLWPKFEDGKRFQQRRNNGRWIVYGVNWDVCVCEREWMAQLICDALNRENP